MNDQTTIFTATERDGLLSREGVERLLHCPGSVALGRGLTVPEPLGDSRPGDPQRAASAPERADEAEWAVSRCEELSAQVQEMLGFDGPAVLVKEEPLWLRGAEGQPLCSGQVGFALIEVSRRAALIFDWRLERGPVETATWYPQLIAQAVLLAQEHGIEEAYLQLVWPWGELAAPARLDRAGLATWRKALLEAVAAAREPEAPRRAGPHCRGCPARAICPEGRAASVAPGLAQREEWSVSAVPVEAGVALRACPFCGSARVALAAGGTHPGEGRRRLAAVCEGCGGTGPDRERATAAGEAWNARFAGPPPPPVHEDWREFFSEIYLPVTALYDDEGVRAVWLDRDAIAATQPDGRIALEAIPPRELAALHKLIAQQERDQAEEAALQLRLGEIGM